MYFFFTFRLGYKIATHPWNTIIVSFLLVLGCSVGVITFHNEKNPLKLWIPQGTLIKNYVI